MDEFAFLCWCMTALAFFIDCKCVFCADNIRRGKYVFFLGNEKISAFGESMEKFQFDNICILNWINTFNNAQPILLLIYLDNMLKVLLKDYFIIYLKK